MKNQIPILILIISMMLCMFSQYASSTINVVPKPNLVNEMGGTFTFKQGMFIVAPLHSGAVALLKSKLDHAAGICLQLTLNKKKAAIILSIDTVDVHTPEGYQMNIDKNCISIKAATETGLYYGIQTLLQLLPPQIENNQLVKATWKVPCVSITDAPKFAYRGILLDACRHFISVAHIEKLLDVLAMYKINWLHWHLTDDQGWRIEIKRYPKLTQIGATRTDENGKPNSGYYTQDQIKEIVKYAAARHIEVFPEIEMPGHALAALAAYPQYSCTGGPFKVRTTWGIEKNVYCAGNDSMYAFLSHIFDEVYTLFPSHYIQIGGDECLKDRWKECPKCQARMKSEGIKSEDDLQNYFEKRIVKILEKKGEKIIGWEQILEGGDIPSATIISWSGEKGCINAVNAGHDVILTTVPPLYLDFYQGSPLCESVKIGGLTTLQQVYVYNPIPNAISPAMVHHVLGLQGNLWSEYLYTPHLFDYQLFPRALAIAETGWTKPTNKDVNDFIRRMDDQQIRLDEHQINYYIPMPEGNLNYMEFSDSLRLPFTTNRPVKVVYTRNGTTPIIHSKTYTTPILITKTTTLKLRSILPQGKMSAVRTIRLTKTVPLQGIDTLAHLQQGLRLKYTGKGYYVRVNQLKEVRQWKDSIVSQPNEFFNLVPIDKDGKSYPEQTQGAGIFTGYLYIAHAGLYRLQCEADELIVNNRLLINNEGKIKKSVLTDITVPFQAGYHPIKMIVLNNIWGGVPASLADFHINLMEWKGSNSEELLPAPVYYTK
jgi:hexosaminidase